MFCQISVDGQAMVQPAADEVAGRTSAIDHFVVTAAAAEITSPAASTRLLLVHVPTGKPGLLGCRIDSSINVTKSTLRILNKSVTSEKTAVGRNTKVTGAGTARIWPVCTAMNLYKCLHDVRKRVGPVS